MASVDEIIERHREAGRPFEAGGTGSFALEQGDGEAVVLLHGVPSSSFLYRKVIPPLAESGLRALAFDYPGLGLADRPEDFDYSWSGLARFTGQALDALGVDRCHLVVHDIAGPIGVEWAASQPERVASLTVLNTLLAVASFRRPWTMHPFSIRGVGEVYLRTMTAFAFKRLFYHQGVRDRSAVSGAEVEAYFRLLKLRDGGRAFLRIMRGFELTEEKEHLLRQALASRPYPAQIVWGADDPALGRSHLDAAREMLGIEDPVLLPAKHFLQEDQAPAVAALIADLARSSAGAPTG